MDVCFNMKLCQLQAMCFHLFKQLLLLCRFGPSGCISDLRLFADCLDTLGYLCFAWPLRVYSFEHVALWALAWKSLICNQSTKMPHKAREALRAVGNATIDEFPIIEMALQMRNLQVQTASWNCQQISLPLRVSDMLTLQINQDNMAFETNK